MECALMKTTGEVMEQVMISCIGASFTVPVKATTYDCLNTMQEPIPQTVKVVSTRKSMMGPCHRRCRRELWLPFG
jgi:hypothetical protein